MIGALIVLVCVVILFLLKYEVTIKKNWQGTYIVWKTLKQDMISGEYYEIYLSKKIF